VDWPLDLAVPVALDRLQREQPKPEPVADDWRV